MRISLRGIGFAAVVSMLAVGCGSTSSPSSPTASDGPIGATLTITSAGISPKTNTIPVGSRITIVNNDTRSHEMDSDPHPEHNQCPALNIGTLAPGQSGTSANLTPARTCGMHDHSDPDNSLWKTTIIAQ